MADERVEIDGVQYMRRRTSESAAPLNQEVHTEIEETTVSIEIQGLESKQRRPVRSDDPAVVQHYRDLDYAQFVVSLAERPESPEPRRIPEGHVPPGMRRCWLCDGRGMVEEADGVETDCVVCGGDGVIPDGAP